MAQKQPRERTDKVYRSIEEFKEHFLPNTHAKESVHKKNKDPKSFGTGLVQELLEGIKQEIRK